MVRFVIDPAIARSACRRSRRERTRNLHDAARHAVRREIHGDRARPSARRRGRAARSRRSPLHRGMPQGRHLGRRDRDGGEEGLRHRPSGRPSVRPGLAAAGLCRQFHPDGLRHRRDFRLPGARSARPRLRQRLRPRRDPGRLPARTSTRRPSRSTTVAYDGDGLDDQFALPRRDDDRRGQGGGRAPAGGGDDRRSPAGQAAGQLQAARLGHFPPALLGLPDSGHPLRGLRRRARSRRRICRSGCPTT